MGGGGVKDSAQGKGCYYGRLRKPGRNCIGATAEGGRIWLVGRWKEVVFGRFPDNLFRRRSSRGVWGIQTIWMGAKMRLGGNNGCGRV